jgi:dipeptidyl-peptidase-4
MALVSHKGKILFEISNTKGDKYEETMIAKTELLRIKSEDSKYDLPFRIIWPLQYDSTKKYPLLINIYGGPNAGTVYDGWDLRMQQQWWASEGLIQVAMDHRGSGHFGKEGMNALHRNLGYWEMKDWITIVKWLIQHAGVDPQRVCISGFSYGGYSDSWICRLKIRRDINLHPFSRMQTNTKDCCAFIMAPWMIMYTYRTACSS